MRTTLTLLALMLFCLVQVSAQDPLVVFSQNKCHWNRLDELQASIEEHAAPVLDGLVEEGKLLGWGVLTHAWGDEWNWNVYYVAADIPTFLEAFDLFVDRWAERDPDSRESFWDMCYEHKDAMYRESLSSAAIATGGSTLKSMTLFDIPDGVSEEDLKASIEKVNRAIAGIGYPGSGYSFYKVNDDTVSDYRYLIEGSWPDQEAYDKIHESEEWKNATGEDSELWDKVLAKRLYRRFHRQ